jgi:hypothetical protein
MDIEGVHTVARFGGFAVRERTGGVIPVNKIMTAFEEEG